MNLAPAKPQEEQGVGRRGFLVRTLATALAFVGTALSLPVWAAGGSRPPVIHRPQDPTHPTEFERLHVPRVRMSEVIEDGANAPCFVEMDHPMDPDHYITNIQILNYHDPIIWKGTFHFTPESGRAYLYTQLRLDAGKSNVYAVAECNRHGRWAGSADVNVAVGGC